MIITFHKLADDRHTVSVERSDGSTDTVELSSKDFLRHDLAHFAVELELGLTDGVWGCVARGGTLDGSGLDGPDMSIAESLAGPVQTMLRTGPEPDQLLALLRRVVPDRATEEMAAALHERLRSLTGHWNATSFGRDMVLSWPD